MLQPSFPSQVRKSQIVEKHGTLVGFSDPFENPRVSPFLVTAVKQSEVFMITKAALMKVRRCTSSVASHSSWPPVDELTESRTDSSFRHLALQVLSEAHESDRHAVCLLVQLQHNNVLDGLKV